MFKLLRKFNNDNIKFFLKHKIRFMIFIIVTLIGFISIPYLESLQNYLMLKHTYGDQYISGRQAKKIENQFDYIIDVRSAEEYDSNHVQDAVNISHESILNNPSVLFESHKITKDDVLFIYCKSGNRASQVVEKLLENGFEKSNIYFTHNNVSKLEKDGFVLSTTQEP